ncbi:MAG: hypothetical protein QOJ41_2825 [Acidobacteriaceae bacterium]|nr:hypothetical protein [Acidobacteriaceae bacterium]
MLCAGTSCWPVDRGGATPCKSLERGNTVLGLFSLLRLDPYLIAPSVFRGIQGFVGPAYQRREIENLLAAKASDSKARSYGDFFVPYFELLCRQLFAEAFDCSYYGFGFHVGDHQ